jgi:DNA-binding MarR family transcriptional regulator
MRLEDAIKTNRFTNENHKASINLLYTSYWLKNNYSRVMKDGGLTLEQYNILRILKGKHPETMCIKDIAQRIIEKSSNVPRIINRLMVKKLVKRSVSNEDKRETLITLTDKGLDALAATTALMNQLSAEIIGLTEEDALQLNLLLEKMRKSDLAPEE